MSEPICPGCSMDFDQCCMLPPTAEIHVIGEATATPQQVLVHAYGKAKSGEVRDVVIVATMQDGTMQISYAGCSAGDLAAAALYVQAEAAKQLKLTQ